MLTSLALILALGGYGDGGQDIFSGALTPEGSSLSVSISAHEVSDHDLGLLSSNLKNLQQAVGAAGMCPTAIPKGRAEAFTHGERLQHDQHSFVDEGPSVVLLRSGL